MRLYVAVREGDFVSTTWSPFGADITWRMSKSGDFEGTDERQDRWSRLDRAMKFCTVEGDETLSVSGLTEAALDAARSAGLVDGPVGSIMDPSVSCWLADPATDRTLDPQSTVQASGLQDEDLVVLSIEHPSTTLHELMPAPNPQRLFSQLQFAQAALTDDTLRLHGVLLYTDADVELATFVRTHFDELNALSGDLFQIFVMERPTDWRTAKRYWRSRMNPELYRLLAALQWLKWVPYDKLGAYEAARKLRVPLGELPCLVLFRAVRDHRKFVFPIQDASVAEFRRIFGALSETIQGVDDPDGGSVAVRLAEAEKRFRAEVIPSARQGVSFEFMGSTVFIHGRGDAVTENFNFYGQTTFINRPTDTVISDLQNTYSATPAATDLAGLLRLVLGSEDLDDEGRERVARLIHQLAEDLDSQDSGKARTKLERIRTTVGRAADIAAPAIGIVAKVLELLP